MVLALLLHHWDDHLIHLLHVGHLLLPLLLSQGGALVQTEVVAVLHLMKNVCECANWQIINTKMFQQTKQKIVHLNVLLHAQVHLHLTHVEVEVDIHLRNLMHFSKTFFVENCYLLAFCRRNRKKVTTWVTTMI